MRWFRFYDDAINDPKILKLSDKLYRLWVGILCAASKNNGQLPPLDDLALVVRWKSEKLKAALESLIESNLIDVDGVVLKPHNWDKRQFKSDVSNERVKRYRQRQCNVTVAPPDTESDTDTEKKDAAVAAHDPEKLFFDQAAQSVGRPLAAKLLKAKGGNVALAHSALLTATTKSDPREYLGAIIRGREREGKSEWAF